MGAIVLVVFLLHARPLLSFILLGQQMQRASSNPRHRGHTDIPSNQKQR
jgi:hypothetical protein